MCPAGEAAANSLAADGYHPLIVKHCLKVYGSPSATAASASGGGEAMEVDASADVWALDEGKVCVHFAEKLLLGPDPAQQQSEAAAAGISAAAPWVGVARWPLTRFMQQLQAAVPAPFVPSLEKLKGEVLVDGKR